MRAALSDEGFTGQFTPGEPVEHPPTVLGLRSPGWAQDGGLRLRLHGDVYNAPELCDQLGLNPETAPADALLAGWQRWSEGLFHRIDGVFALAIEDRDRLRLYRDPSGLRNLYLHTGQRGRAMFGTHLAELMRLPGSTRRVARHSLHEYLRFGDVAAPHTIYEDVQAVQAGHLVCWSPRGLDVRPIAGPEPDEAAPHDFAVALDRLEAHLTRSVRRRLEHSERPASFLSGGIDSALLGAIASRQRKDLTAVTVGFDNGPDDESPVARRIAAHLEIRHEVLRFSRADCLRAFERVGSAVEQPMADPALLPTLLAFEHCRERFDVVIDGTGADEALGLMPPRHVRWAVEYASTLPRPLRAGITKLISPLPSLAAYSPIVDFEHPADTMIRWRGFTRPEIERLCAETVSFGHTEFYRTFHRYPRSAHFERFSALMNVMPCDRLNQAMLLSGLAVRFPFWDSRTDRFVRSLPVDHRYSPTEPKRILRALLATLVPSAIWEVPKHGFNFPVQEFLAADDHAMVKRLRDPAPWRGSGQLSHEQVQRYAAQFMAGDTRLTFRIWALVLLGAWLEKNDNTR